MLDLGAGTGKFTKLLLATGADVLAAEPVAAMRARLVADLPQVTTIEGTAESIPLPDSAVDAVVCAQSFHWFATREALNEIHRVIAPGGRLALVWNMRGESVPWVERLSQLIAPYEGDTPRFRTGRWRDVFPTPGFAELEETRLPHGHTGPPDQVIIDRTLSISFIAALPDDERSRLAEHIRELIAAEPTLAGQLEVTVPYVTLAYTTMRQ